MRWKLRTRPQPEEELGAGGRSALQGEACCGEQTVAVGGQRRRGGGKPAGTGRCLSLDPGPFPVSNIIVLSAAIMYIVLTFNLPPPAEKTQLLPPGPHQVWKLKAWKSYMVCCRLPLCPS